MADNVTTDELELALQELAEGMGLSVKEYVEGGFLDLTTYGTDKAAIEARLDALDVIDAADGVDTLAEKVAALNAMFTENGDLATDVLNRIAVNATAIGSAQTQLDNYIASNDAAQATQDANIAGNTATLGTLTQTVADNKTSSEAADAVLAGRATDVEADIAILNSDDTVVGSVANSVKGEETRAKAAELANRNTSDANIATAKQEAIDAAGVVSDAGDAALQTQIDNLGTGATDTDATIAALQGELDVTQTGLGLNSDGTFTPVDGADSLEEYVQNVSGDADSLKKAIRKVARKSKAADIALDNKIIAETAAREAADTAMQDEIDALGGSGSGSLGDVENRLDVVEGAINDGVDGNGDLVKGLSTKVQDNTDAIAAEVTARTAAMQTQLDDLKAYSDSKDLKASSMDICTVGNRFRTALGLGNNTCDGSGGTGSGEL